MSTLVADALGLGRTYASRLAALTSSIVGENAQRVHDAAVMLADRVAADELLYVYGPGGHSNLATQDVFYRPGMPMNVSPVISAETLLTSGALRSTEAERTPGHGGEVIRRAGLAPGDVLILVNAFGINSAVIDAAMQARALDVVTIGISSSRAARDTSLDHPARHPMAVDLQDVVDVHIDSCVPQGDTVLELAGGYATGGTSTILNSFCLHWLMMTTIALLAARGVNPPIWKSRNAPDGDELDERLVQRFAGRVSLL